MTNPNHDPPIAAVESTPKGRQRAADRLNIPSSVVQASGFTPGDNAFVTDEDPSVPS